MKPKNINGKWYIEVTTKELGNVLLLDNSGLPNALEFKSEKKALEHIKTITNLKNNKNNRSHRALFKRARYGRQR